MKRTTFGCGSKHRFLRFLKEFSMRESIRFQLSKVRGINNEEGD